MQDASGEGVNFRVSLTIQGWGEGGRGGGGEGLRLEHKHKMAELSSGRCGGRRSGLGLNSIDLHTLV